VEKGRAGRRALPVDPPALFSYNDREVEDAKMFATPFLLRGLLVLGIGPYELILVLVIVIVLFGARRLPEIGAGLGKGIRSFKDALSDGKKEIESPKEQKPS
jgi:sec-independent protein translocase protein TatA